MRCAELINNAKKPFALVGHGVELGGSHNELIEFLEKADIPAGRTLLGLSALPSNHPLNMDKANRSIDVIRVDIDRTICFICTSNRGTCIIVCRRSDMHTIYDIERGVVDACSGK